MALEIGEPILASDVIPIEITRDFDYNTDFTKAFDNLSKTRTYEYKQPPFNKLTFWYDNDSSGETSAHSWDVVCKVYSKLVTETEWEEIGTPINKIEWQNINTTNTFKDIRVTMKVTIAANFGDWVAGKKVSTQRVCSLSTTEDIAKQGENIRVMDVNRAGWMTKQIIKNLLALNNAGRLGYE